MIEVSNPHSSHEFKEAVVFDAILTALSHSMDFSEEIYPIFEARLASLKACPSTSQGHEALIEVYRALCVAVLAQNAN